MRYHRSGRCSLLSEVRTLTAVIGLSLTALSLTGSTEKPATSSRSRTDSRLALRISREHDAGREKFFAGDYLEAGNIFLAVAQLAERAGDSRDAAMNWNNAGGAELARLDYRDALADFLKARRIAQASREFVPLAAAMNNLASLYLEMGNPGAAVQVAGEALAGPAGDADLTIRPKLRYQLANGLARTGRFDDAEGFYRAAVNELEEQGNFDATARILANWGDDALNANRPDEAESVLSDGLLLVRVHHLAAAANVLRGLARVKSRRGDIRAAAVLFDAALDAPQNLTPRWLIYADRAQFRLDHGDLAGALSDFREAHRLALLLRADIVPADLDRITLEGGLSRVGAGLVEAGNRLALQRSDPAILKETFDTAEEDRLWSLRALTPAANDWRARLPESYWDLLARYQAAERALLAQPSSEAKKQALALQLKLQEIEAVASPGLPTERVQSALAHLHRVLDADSVLFSFQVKRSGGWLWAVDRHGVDVIPIPGLEDLQPRVAAFAQAAREGDERATALGERLYRDLFASVPAAYRTHKRWLLELDGPLFDLPFGALTVNDGGRKNELPYLIERATLQVVPGALMLEARDASLNTGTREFLGIGDPVYNAADSRYTGNRSGKQDVVLPRLLATGEELKACSRAWGSTRTRVLTGVDANLPALRAALRDNPSIIHFATHIVRAPTDHSSGLIALSLDGSGAMTLMGPAEIVARPVSADLVVLNGCHSAEGDALPGSGLMGLTRAWIGAGARAVLATRWDIPDDAGKAVMAAFYRSLRAHPEGGPAAALRQVQLSILKGNSMQHTRSTAAIWAAYFLLGRN